MGPALRVDRTTGARRLAATIGALSPKIKQLFQSGRMIEAQAPNLALRIIDDAIQAHGGGGVTSDFGLARAYANRRLRLADGPDGVHNRTIARMELGRWRRGRRRRRRSRGLGTGSRRRS